LKILKKSLNDLEMELLVFENALLRVQKRLRDLQEKIFKQEKKENDKAAGLPRVPEGSTSTGQDCNHTAPAETAEQASAGTGADN
jgi:hypothetical protein